MRYLFLFLFSTCAQLTFAQENGETTFEHPCFKQLLVTVKNYGYLKDNKAYGWGIKIKNNYKAPVSFTYALLVGDESRGNGQPTYTISPGDTWAADWGGLHCYLKAAVQLSLELRFGAYASRDMIALMKTILIVMEGNLRTSYWAVTGEQEIIKTAVNQIPPAAPQILIIIIRPLNL
jgi:hypothetical protein